MERELIRVAYAEDHTFIRKAVIAHLQSLGNIRVDIEAENGQDLVEKLESADKLPDICIIDINMPVMDGFVALKEVRDRWPFMKALILTTYSQESYVIHMIHSGANGYLLKKCTEDEIIDAIISIHDNGFYYSECAGNTLFNLVESNAIKLPSLTDAEIEVLKYCCTDLSYLQIAEKMDTSLKSIHGCIQRLFNKLSLTNRVGLIIFAIKFGYVSIDVPLGIPKLKAK